MFRNIRSLATEIGTEIDGKIKNTNEHLVGKPLSAATSRTKRFLRRSGDGSTGTPTRSSSSSSPGFSFRNRHKEWEEIDGSTEEDTVVHRALVQHFKQQGRSLPTYLVSTSRANTNDTKEAPQRRTIARTHTAPATTNTQEPSSRPPASSAPSMPVTPSAPISRSQTSRFHSRFGSSSSSTDTRPSMTTTTSSTHGGSSTRFGRRA